MRILLDTNIVIHREANLPINEGIGYLFYWIDNLGFKKCIHQVTVDEILKTRNLRTRKAFGIKLGNYYVLPISAKLHPDVARVSAKYDITDNDLNDTILLNELYCGRVEAFITEDRVIHAKARVLAIDDRVYTIDAFLEKTTAEHPELVDYIVPSIRKEYFGNINLEDSFFDSLRKDYKGFDDWFRRKAYDTAYVCTAGDKLTAFLYLKKEDENEPYTNIDPQFSPCKRLKIGTFKVELNGYKIGERFLKIVFDNAFRFRVDEIYVTLFPRSVEQVRLVRLLEDFGFYRHGIKTTESGEEEVYTRTLGKTASLESPKETYPFMSRRAGKFLVPIYSEYHTNLFPDSILRTESPMEYAEHEPHRNAISKVYVSRSYERELRSGDIIVFYRTGGYYKGVVSTLGIVENIVTDIEGVEQFRSLCRKRSVFTDKELEEIWNFGPYNRPFIVNFLYAYSFPKRVNLKRLIELEVIRDIQSVPRGFERLPEASFEAIVKETQTDESIIVD